MGDMTKSFQTVLEYNTDKYELDFEKLKQKVEKDQKDRMK